jgi:hypothetical protein
MNLVEIRNKASESMSMLDRKIRRLLGLDGQELGKNGTEVSAFVEGVLSEWDRYSEIKRQVASVRSMAMIRRLDISFTEADIMCRDLDDQIEFLDTILDKVDVRVFDDDGNPLAEPHLLICFLRTKVEELSQMRAKIRSAAETCEHEVNVVWYDDDDVQDLMRVSVSKREKPAVRESVPLVPLVKTELPKPIQPVPSRVIEDEECPVCMSPGRAEIERCFRAEKFNIMITLDKSIARELVPIDTVPNDLRMHFDRHVDGIFEMEGR